MRERVFAAYEEAWDALAHVGAQILNHLAGFRLTLYRLRGWEDFLREPLEMNRLTRPTLEAMWAAVEAENSTLVRYLKAKADLLGLEALAWYDVDASIVRRPSSAEQKVPYEEARGTIVRNFSAVNPEWGALALRAFREGWIEAEDRPGKRAGGFCTSFPITGVSRIFLTYGGTKGSFATLAHELGHAYHQWVVRHLPVLAQGYPMSLAETASTFAEIVVQDRLLEEAEVEERLS
ncbi:MAG TPA: oligoendopeptidase, partial [Bacillaceae bacterium]|nr:oligoendopeptidase [Bacillaceae bacterium]